MPHERHTRTLQAVLSLSSFCPLWPALAQRSTVPVDKDERAAVGPRKEGEDGRKTYDAADKVLRIERLVRADDLRSRERNKGRRRATRAAPKAAPCIVAVAAAVERSEGSEGERRERENRQMGN